MDDIMVRRRVPASAKAEQRIRDILRVAREVFAEMGYERATTTEIAQRLGISEATVFTYFHGKRELCVRVIEDWYDEIIAAVEEGMPRGLQLRQAVSRIDVHQHQPKARGGELRHQPLHPVRRPDADAVPALQAQQAQAPGHGVHHLCKFPPAPADALLAKHHRLAIRETRYGFG